MSSISSTFKRIIIILNRLLSVKLKYFPASKTTLHAVDVDVIHSQVNPTFSRHRVICNILIFLPVSSQRQAFYSLTEISSTSKQFQSNLNPSRLHNTSIFLIEEIVGEKVCYSVY